MEDEEEDQGEQAEREIADLGQRSDEVERELDDLEHRSEEVGRQIDETETDWEARQGDQSVPGAVAKENVDPTDPDAGEDEPDGDEQAGDD